MRLPASPQSRSRTPWRWIDVGLHSNSSIYVAMRQAATALGQSIKLRIQVTWLDAMCRMIHNGLGVGVMPLRAFTLMHNAR